MADPFEVRMRFTAQLGHLSASTSSAIKAANYALKYSEFSDDLQSCILEQLEKPNMNNRANIMYFLPTLCETARAHGETAYLKMVERDILQIIDLVAPDERGGAANVKVVRKVLQQLEMKEFLQPHTVKELLECISGREGAGDEAESPARENHAPVKAHVPVVTTSRSAPHASQRESHAPGGLRLDKRQIEQRIEEDRERHKRAREGIWAIPQAKVTAGVDAEFEKLWDEVSDLDEDDYNLMKEEAQERRRWLEFEDT